MKRLLPFLMLGLGALVLTVALLTLLDTPGSGAPLPSSLAGEALRDAVYGPEAVTQIAQLHGKEISLVSGAVGTYGAAGRTVLWVSESASQQEAADLTATMEARIAEGRSPFTSLGIRTEGARQIYVLEGMGQQHFYFQAGPKVIWLAANPAEAEQALQETLTFFTTEGS